MSVVEGCTTAWAQRALLADNPYKPGAEPLQLAKMAGSKGILYGMAVAPRRLPPSSALWDTEPYSQLIKRQTAIITNANMHFDLVEPTLGQFNFTVPDRITMRPRQRVANAWTRSLLVRALSQMDGGNGSRRRH